MAGRRYRVAQRIRGPAPQNIHCPRCDAPRHGIGLPDCRSNAWEAKMHFSKRRSSNRRSWVAPHAKERVSQRSTLSATSVREMVDAGRCVSLGEVPPNRRCYLIYSKVDDRSYVVVQDMANWAVITVLPLWMWNNDELSESSPQADEARRLALEPAYSTPNRTPIPRRTEHGFHSKPSVDSTANRAGIPRLPERDFHA
ncbi:hypothetical protein OKW41_000369 [Paraburkholderia sp. UCT70]